jgi:DNA invertase Pin-like site-specific DNA recombinase
MRAAIYLRVSTAKKGQKAQTTENQERELRTVADRLGAEVVIYADQGISGAKGRDKRPAFDQMLKDAARHQFELIMAWS